MVGSEFGCHLLVVIQPFSCGWISQGAEVAKGCRAGGAVLLAGPPSTQDQGLSRVAELHNILYVPARMLIANHSTNRQAGAPAARQMYSQGGPVRPEWHRKINHPVANSR